MLDDKWDDIDPVGVMGLARRITKAGYATRRQVEEMVRSGRVRVDGKRVLDPSASVAGDQEIVIDDQLVQEVIRSYFAFNKPDNVSTNPIVGHRMHPVSEYLPRDIPGLRPAGRLDANTTGLLLASNDSAWNSAAASGHGHEKEFLVRTVGLVSDNQLEVMAAGVQLPRLGALHPSRVILEHRHDKNSAFRITLSAGKIRQIRTLCKSLHVEVQSIHRLRIGPVSLGTLEPGRYRPLTREEIEGIRRGA